MHSISTLGYTDSELQFFDDDSLFSTFVFSVSAYSFIYYDSDIIFYEFGYIFSDYGTYTFLFDYSLPVHAFDSSESTIYVD